jgi:hypothetical protein
VAVGCALARFLLDHVVPDDPVALVGDDTTDGHAGPKVYGKGRHRDPIRSTHSHTAWRYRHKWVVLAVLVRFPYAARRWALPVLVDLYRTPEVSKAEGVRHRPPARLMCRLLRLVLVRFPGRTFVFAGDSGYGTHEVARFCRRYRRRLTLVGKLHPDANLHDPPAPRRGGVGRPAVRGPRVRASVRHANGTYFSRTPFSMARFASCRGFMSRSYGLGRRFRRRGSNRSGRSPTRWLATAPSRCR